MSPCSQINTLIKLHTESCIPDFIMLENEISETRSKELMLLDAENTIDNIKDYTTLFEIILDYLSKISDTARTASNTLRDVRQEA